MEQLEFGSREAASMGGIARKKALTASERSEIARSAVEARWAKHGAKDAPRAIREAILKIGNIEFECAVLDDKENTRVLSERAFSRAIGAKRGGSHWQRQKRNLGGAYLPVFLSANNLIPFISSDLAAALSEPLEYVTERGHRANGTKATLIPQILDVWIKARNAGRLNKRQMAFAEIADIVKTGLATTGLIALIDEATGFQDIRARDALAKILEAFVAKELQKWVGTFSPTYYRELCRLRNWPFRENFRSPRYAGKLTDDIVYRRLAPGVRDELRRLNPVDETGRRKKKHFQWLTPKLGHPRLKEHLAAVEALMIAADDWPAFMKMLNRALPPKVELPLLDALDHPGGDISPAATS